MSEGLPIIARTQAASSSKTAAEKPMLAVLKGARRSPPPIWLMRQAGRYLPEYRALRAQVGGFLDLCYNPELAAEVTLQPIRRFGFDAAILFADILLVPDALGQQVAFKEGEGPVLEPVRSAADIDAFSLERIDEHLAPVFETVSRVSASLPRETALIGFAGAPWTVATYMIQGRGSPDHAEAKLFAFREPEMFERLIDLLTEATVRYLSRQIDAGAEIVQLFDSWASALPAWAIRRWSIAPARRIVSALGEKYPDIPVIGFPRAIGPLYEDYLRETGVAAVSIDGSLSTAWAAAHLQPFGAVQGNLDPLVLRAGGGLLDHEAGRIVENLAGGPHIFGLGHGILKETPVAHVERLVELARGLHP